MLGCPIRSGKPHRIRRGACLALALGTVLTAGAATGSWHAAGPREDGAGRIHAGPAADSEEIAAAIHEGKVGPEAAEAMVSRSGDRWSAYYTAQEYEGFQQALDGRYVGVGLWVRRAGDGRVEVARVQSGSPAEEARIQAGDRIRSIDGEAVDGSPVTEVVSRLRGDAEDPGRPGAGAGTPVTLRLQCRGDGGGDAREVTLRRAVLTAEAVTVRQLGSDVTSIEIDAFTKGVGDQVRQAVRGATGGVLLDLRGNSGGLVTEAVAVASVFLDGGLVATYDVHGEQRALYAQDGGDTGTPLAVLVDGGTMSAAELLAGALQDRGRAVLVGSRTFGKGSVQMPSRLSDGSVAELTVGHYRLPAGRTVDRHGVEPDLAVPGGGSADEAVAQARTVLSGLGTPS